MKKISPENLSSLCKGAAILGSGGGGDTQLLASTVLQSLMNYGSVPLIKLADLNPQSLVVPVAFVGSPEATKKNGLSLPMFSALLDSIMNDHPHRSLVLMPAEIGGCNALTPFVIAGKLSLPVLDADLIGRAFPKVSMCKPAVTLRGQPIMAYMSGHTGECVKFMAKDIHDLERQAREIAVTFGGSGVIATYLFEASEASQIVIADSISRALKLGEKQDFSQTEFQSISEKPGIISELIAQNKNGFLFGSCCIAFPDKKIDLYFQNEYLCLKQKGEIIAQSPTLIVLLDEESQLPIPSEMLRPDVRVRLLTLNAPNFWYENEARKSIALDQFELGAL